ncbi:MAG TPA: ankyrin repeat domain-containing protein [Blastocatellia bacterium]
MPNEQPSDAIWESAKNGVINGDAAALDRLLSEHSQLLKNARPPAYVPRGPAPSYDGENAQSIIAREHHFANWEEYTDYITTQPVNSSISQFEAAVDAIVEGDQAGLERLLRENPNLIRMKSGRIHHATLLHYVGANGVEGFRQKTPANIVQITKALLAAGADVDAVADIYGGSTTVGLVATSIHPRLAGVQNMLMELLLDRGASIDTPGSRRSRAINDCLANGRPEAAELLARRGAALDLEGAAGVGNLDLVKRFFEEDGTLKAIATKEQMESGFAWACEYGRTAVVDFLLNRGMDVNVPLRHHGQTGLHWAAAGGHLDTVKLLLDRGARVNAPDQTWGGTPLGWALHQWVEDRQESYYPVVATLVAAGATVNPEWLTDQSIVADQRMLAALQGRS